MNYGRSITMKGKKMKTLTLVLTLTIAAANGMAQAATPEHDMTLHQMPSASSAANHQGVGILKEVNTKSGKVLIAHEAIADLSWPPMTMWFALRDPLPKDLKAGDAVRFEMMQGEKKQWVIVNIWRK
jgi:Cu(I)/Ag(I) efflux system periplasmic protein CusF